VKCEFKFQNLQMDYHWNVFCLVQVISNNFNRKPLAGIGLAIICLQIWAAKLAIKNVVCDRCPSGTVRLGTRGTKNLYLSVSLVPSF